MSIDGTTDASAGRARETPFTLARRAFSAWRARTRELRTLAAMDERSLKDIGLSHYDVSAEAVRWRRRA